MTDEMTALLREIRDQQRLQLERQAEALAVQREQFGLYQRQLDRVDGINDRAEAIQRRAAKAAKLVLWLLLPLLALALLALLWPYVLYLVHWLP